MSPVVAPQIARRPRPLPATARRPDSAMDALAAASTSPDDLGILQTLRGYSLSQWIVLLFPLFLFAVHRKRDEGDVAVVDSSAFIQIGLTAFCGVWMVNRLLHTLRAIERILVHTPLRWLLMYVVLAVLSIAWSDAPQLTAFRSVQLCVFLLVVVDAIASMRGPQEMIRFQLLYAALVVALWQLPGLQGGLSLWAIHSSDVPGTVVAAVFVGFLARGRAWRILHLCVVAAAVLATSTGFMLACTGGLIVVLLLMRGRAAGLGVMMLCGLVLAVVLLPQYANSVYFFGKNEGQIVSGTGRLPIWQWILEERVSARPMLGFGFAQGEVQARLYNIGGFRMMHMHNAFMSAIVNLGLAGVTLWAMTWGAMARRAWKVPDPRARLAMMGTVVAVFLNTGSMESFTAPLTMPWIAHVMFFVLLAVGQWEAPKYAVPRLRPPHRRVRPQPATAPVAI